MEFIASDIVCKPCDMQRATGVDGVAAGSAGLLDGLEVRMPCQLQQMRLRHGVDWDRGESFAHCAVLHVARISAGFHTLQIAFCKE